MNAQPLQITLFGAPQITRGGKPVNKFATNKTLALFCYLAMTRQPHTRDALAGMFWAEMPNTDARANLRKALSNLNKLFPDTFIITRRTIAFNTDVPHTLDVAVFSDLLAKNTDPADANAARLKKAVELYRGEFMAGFYLPDAETFSRWVLGWRERLGEQALQAMYLLAESCLADRKYAAAVDYLKRVLAIDPWREAVHRQLMLTLMRMGQRNAALAQYHTCRKILAAELGVLPSSETRLLFERIEAAESASPVLPRQPTPFVGRATELDTAANLLSRPTCRLLTIVGLGGIGKTRLAIRLAQNIGQHFLDGVFFVPLAAAQTEQSLLQAIGKTINFTFGDQGDPAEQLENFLAPRELLLVLDNFEHLLPTVPLLENLLQNTTGVKMLITSRQKLHSRWEHTLLLTGFPPDSRQTPNQRPPAIELFAQNARRVRPDFTLSAADEQAVLAISRELAGIPLGIELAARWVSTLSVPEILQNIRRELTFVDGAIATANSRHSLQTVLTHTWAQLSPTEQTQFSRLSVFAGAFTATDAAEIAGVSPETLSQFVERGMVAPAIMDTPASQFEMHQLWQQFARKKLAANPADDTRTHARHAHHNTAILAECAAGIEHRDTSALAKIDNIFDNLLPGWEWLLANGDTAVFKTATDQLTHYLTARNRYGELKTVQEKAIARIKTESPPDTLQLAQWYRQLGETCFRLGQLSRSLNILHKTLFNLNHKMPSKPAALIFGLGREIAVQMAHRLRQGKQHPADDPRAIPFLVEAQTYERLGQILFFENTPTPTLLFTSLRGMNSAEKVAPSDVLARLYGNMILGFGLVPVHRLARFYRRLALKTARQTALPAAVAWVLEVSSIYFCGIGQWEKAAEDAHGAIAIAEKLGDTRRQDECRVMPAHIAHSHGEFRRSAEIWLDIYVSSYNRGDVQAQRWGLAGQAENFLPLGRVEESISHLKAALELPLKVEDIGTDITCYGLLAEAYVRRRENTAAAHFAELGLRLVSETAPAAFSSLGGYAALAYAHLHLWEMSPADAALAAAAENTVAKLWQFSRIFSIAKPQALLHRGTLAWMQHKSHRAIHWWEKGIAAAKMLGMPYQQARIFAEMAHRLPEGHPKKEAASVRAAELSKMLNVPLFH